MLRAILLACPIALSTLLPLSAQQTIGGVSPFSTVERVAASLHVQVDGPKVFELLAINDVATDELLARADEFYGDRALKRIREDLPQLIDCRGVALDRWLASCQDSAELASRRGECDCQSDCVASRHEAAFARQLSWF